MKDDPPMKANGNSPQTPVFIFVFLSLLATAGHGQTDCVQLPPELGLVGWWPGDGDCQNLVAKDDGSPTSGIAFVEGKVGQAFSFKRPDDCVSSRTPPFRAISNSFTIEFWALPLAGRSSTPESNSGISGIGGQRYAIFPEHGGFFAASIPATGVRAGAGVSVGTNGISVFEHGHITLASLLVYNAPIVGWTHIAVIYNDKVPRLYVNGRLVRIGLRSLRVSVHPSKTFGTPNIDPYGSPVFGTYLGLLDEVRIFDRALLEAEVQTLYRAAPGGGCKNGPFVWIEPITQRLRPGQDLLLEATAKGTPPFSFQWRKDGEPLEDTPRIRGTRSPAILITQTSANDVGGYSVAVSNSLRTSISESAMVRLDSALPGEEAWHLDTMGRIVASPAVSTNGILCVGGWDWKVHAVDALAGKPIWEFQAGGEDPTGYRSGFIEAIPTIGGNGVVHIGSEDGTVRAFELTTGLKRWEFTTAGSVASGFALASDGTVYFGSTDKNVYAVDGQTGRKLWAFATSGSVGSVPAVASDGTVYVGSDDTKLYALDGATGAKRWEFRTGGGVRSSPAIGAEGTVYIGSVGGKVYALNGVTGVKQWEYATFRSIWSSAAIGPDGTVYIGSDDKKVYALDGATGVMRWTFETAGEVRSSPALGADGTVYVGSYDHKLYALDGETGAKRWGFSTGDRITSSPTIGPGGMLYVGSDDGRLYALYCGTALADAPWPMLGHDAAHTGRVSVFTPLVTGDPPVITSTPLSVTKDAGATVTFSVIASGTEPLSYQWQFQGTDLTCQTNPVLSLTMLQPRDAGIYQEVVSNAYGAVTSAPTVLTITGDAPFLTQYLPNRVLKQGQALVLSAPAQGWEPISYNWFFNDVQMPGANGFEYSINAVDKTNAGKYYLQVSNYFGVSTSATAVVTVFTPLKVIPLKTTNQIPIGQGLTLRATVEGDGPFRYQWQINGEAIPGATNDTYSITNIQPKDGGFYRLLVANEAEVVVADVAEVVVAVPPAPSEDRFNDRLWLAGTSGVIRSSNEWASVEAGEPRHAGKAGGHSIWFKWIAPAQGNARFSTAGSSFDTLLGIYTGAELSQLKPAASDEDRGGYLTSQTRFAVEAGEEYQIAIDGFNGAMGTVVLEWSFEPTPEVLPQIVAEPLGQMMAGGSAGMLQVQALGENLRYQWYRNGVAVRGATNSALALTNLGPSQVGGYVVEVMNASGTKTNESQMAFVEVYHLVEGVAANPRLGQDKLQDLSGGGASGLSLMNQTWEGRRAADPNASMATALETAVLSGMNTTLGTAARGPSRGLMGMKEWEATKVEPPVYWQVIQPAGLPPVSGYTVSRWGDTTYDTTQIFENVGDPVISGHSRWQALEVPFGGICTLSTAGSEFDTVLEVVRMDGARLVRVAYDDNGGGDGRSSRVQFEVAAGEEYYVRVAGVGTGKGKYQLMEVFEVPQRYRQWEYRVGEGYIFTLAVPKGMVFRVEGSGDLRLWDGILSTNSATGIYEFRHSDHQRYDHRFYRAVLFP